MNNTPAELFDGTTTCNGASTGSTAASDDSASFEDTGADEGGSIGERGGVAAVTVESVTFASLVSVQWLQEALDNMGFTNPTPVQKESIPALLCGSDTIIQAETGSGKTVAFSLPLLLQVRAAATALEPTGIVVTPTRELALQVSRVVEKLAPDLNPICVIGGMNMDKQIRDLKRDPRVIIGTPGRILDLNRKGFLPLHSIHFFALDEADEMLSMGFIEEVEQILEKIPRSAQGTLISATISPRVTMLAERYLKRPLKIEVVESLRTTSKSELRHLWLPVGAGIMDKPRAVVRVIEHLDPRSAIIFCNTKSDTELLEAVLKRQGRNAQKLNSDLNQSQRNRIMEQLRKEEFNLLIATDLAARGLDVDMIDLVINYSLPENTETYVHRTGRTGRAGRSGTATTLVSPVDIPKFHELKKTIQITFEDFTDAEESPVAELPVSSGAA